MKFFIFSIFVFFAFIVPTPVAAQMDHSAVKEQMDGDVMGTLLVDPENPTSQTQVKLMFKINDKTHNFKIENCNCNVSIVSNGRLPYSQKITTPSATTNGLYSVIVPYTFPRGATYDITFSGQPTAENSFQEFTLDWQLTIPALSQEIQTLKSKKYPSPFGISLILLLSIGIVIVGALIFKKKFHHTSDSS